MNKALCLLLVVSFLSPASADLRIKTVYRVPGMTRDNKPDLERLFFVRGNLQREDFYGFVEAPPDNRRNPVPRMAIITDCSKQIQYQLDLDAKEYREVQFPPFPTEQEYRNKFSDAQKSVGKTHKVRTKDTGETRDFFGRPARRIVTTVRVAEYHEPWSIDYERTVDAWYVEAPQPGCAPEYLRWNRARFLPVDKALKKSGAYSNNPEILFLTDEAFLWADLDLPGGFIVQRRSETGPGAAAAPPGTRTESSVVVEYSEAPLPAALFEIPAGFTKVDHLYGHRKR
jgi:hypothetical protein